MGDVLDEVAVLRRERKRGALASLVESSGSIPMSVRAKMLIRDDGTVAGTIGGGCLEAEILSVGSEVLETERPHTTRYTMTEQQAGESGLNCGGSVRIYTEPIGSGGDGDVYASVLTARSERRECVLATVLASEPVRGHGRNKRLMYADGARLGELGVPGLDEWVDGQAGGVLKRERAAVVPFEESTPRADVGHWRALGVATSQSVEVYLEPFVPPPMLYVFGGGHVGAQICRLAKNVGFHVVVIDDRPSFANADRHPYADDCVVEEIDSVFDSLDFDQQTYVVAATRGHQHDEVVVENAIRTPARYIGMLGSERKKMVLWKRIEERGGDPGRLAEVLAPIGFNIGADDPEEIAVSVVAELIDVRRGSVKEWKTKRQTR